MVKVLVRGGNRPRCFGPSCVLGRGWAAGEWVETHGSGRTGPPTDPHDGPSSPIRRLILLPWERRRCPAHCKSTSPPRAPPMGGGRAGRTVVCSRPHTGVGVTPPVVALAATCHRSDPPRSTPVALGFEDAHSARSNSSRSSSVTRLAPSFPPLVMGHDLSELRLPRIVHGRQWPESDAAAEADCCASFDRRVVEQITIRRNVHLRPEDRVDFPT